MASRNDPWNDERDAELAKCLADGMTFEETAAVLNRKFDKHYTRCAVAGRASRIGLRSKNPASRRGKKAAAKRCQRDQAEKVIAMPSPVIPQCVEVDPMNVPLLELEEHQCRWPVSGEREHTLFCAGLKVEGSSYCEPHRLLALGDPRGRSGSSPAQLAHMRSLMPRAHVLNSRMPSEEA